MSENVKKLIEELKEVMIELHRSAGNLDRAIREIERDYTNTDDKLLFVKVQAKYRENSKHYLFNNLEERENEIWQKLIFEAVKES